MKKPALHDLFILEIQDLYDAEQQILDALPRMADAANHEKVKSAFEAHVTETEAQVERLQQLADSLSFDVEGDICEGMEGLLAEGDKLTEMELDEVIKDLALIGAAQKVEHYEIAGYGTAAALAEQMGHDAALKLLKETLKEEEKTDQKLTDLAMKLYQDIDSN